MPFTRASHYHLPTFFLAEKKNNQTRGSEGKRRLARIPAQVPLTRWPTLTPPSLPRALCPWWSLLPAPPACQLWGSGRPEARPLVALLSCPSPLLAGVLGFGSGDCAWRGPLGRYPLSITRGKRKALFGSQKQGTAALASTVTAFKGSVGDSLSTHYSQVFIEGLFCARHCAWCTSFT